MKKSIAFILPHFYQFYKGGAETQCYYLARELLSRNWQVYYIFESQTKIYKVDSSGIILRSIPKRKGYLKWLNSSSLRSTMEEIKADFWYSRANISYLIFLVKFANKIGGKVIWAFSRDSQFALNWKQQRNASLLINLYNVVNQLFFFNALKKTDIILLQTVHQHNLLRQYRKLEGQVIYNAHPVEQIQLNSDKRKKQLLWIGRLRPFKRPDRLIELAKVLEDHNISMKVIGKVSMDKYGLMLKKYSDETDHLLLLGELKPEEVQKMLLESMFLINTSEYEGFSNTFIEAWLRGVPVFSFEVDPDNIICENKIGLVSKNNSELSQEIIKLCDDFSSWKLLSAKCQEFALDTFDITKAVNRLEKILG
ncbi:glycosyltransferase family 4 protein [Flexithrix dorotheae]|uniref:glycosyltransferase family 4 protein n=1 Tax=Flexithrix dorotheae TaxID=70993 RepID=UPI00037D05B6|nr:glycosyltransferase family 4 protein [Flexithrix dorotheae]